MITQRCRCGQAYKVPDTAVGKKAKCKKCGEIFQIVQPETDPDELEATPSLWDEVEAATQRQKGSVAPQSPRQAEVNDERFGADIEHVSLPPAHQSALERNDDDETPGGFGRDLLTALLFPTSPGNLISFAVIGVILIVMPFIPCFLVSIIIAGWYAAFRFAIIEDAASGEKDIPGISFADGWGEYALNAFRWLGSFALVMFPAVIFLIVSIINGSIDPDNSRFFQDPSLSGLLSGGMAEEPVLSLLLFGGLFFWPISILCITLGGFGCFLRADLILRTIYRTLPAYLLVVVIVLGGELITQLLSDWASQRISGGTGTMKLSQLLGEAAIWYIMLTAVTLYLEIFALLAIGLYYHHFKNRFAWSWG